MNPEVELRQLRSFLTVAEEQHFGRAAARLRIAQPALSQQIRKLERDLGVVLLERTSRSVALTDAGAVLRDRARSLVAQAARDVDEVVRVGAGGQGTLDVGFVSSALPLGPALRVQRFRAAHPLVQVRLTEGYTSLLVERIARGELDLAVVRDPEPRSDLRIEPFRTEPFVAVLPAAHPLSGRPTLRGTELVDEPFVFFPAEAGSLAVERNLAPVTADGGRPAIVQEATNWTTILLLVAAGIGVTVAPESATGTPPPGVVVVPLIGTRAESTLAWASRPGDERPALRAFIAED